MFTQNILVFNNYYQFLSSSFSYQNISKYPSTSSGMVEETRVPPTNTDLTDKLESTRDGFEPSTSQGKNL